MRRRLAALLAIALGAATASAQSTPTSAALKEWDIFAATGGDGEASQNIASLAFDGGGNAGPAGAVWMATQYPIPRLVHPERHQQDRTVESVQRCAAGMGAAVEHGAVGDHRGRHHRVRGVGRRLWAAHRCLHCLDLGTNSITTFARASGDGFDMPRAAALNSAGELFVTEQNGNSISFIAALARNRAPVTTVAPTVRTVAPIDLTIAVQDVAVSPATYTVTPRQDVLTGADNGAGYVRFELSPVALTFPFPMTGYPQPVSIGPVLNDRGQGTGAVFFGEFFRGPILGRRAAARIGRLELGVSPPPPSIAVAPSSATVDPGASTTLNAIAASDTLASGSYTGTIPVSDPAAPNSPQSVAVSLTVDPAPTITLLPTTLTFTGTRWTTCNGVQSGSTVASQTIAVGNSGDATLDYTATASGGAWLSASPLSGAVSPGATGDLTVAVDIRNLARGTYSYSGLIVVADPNATNGSQSADVTLTIGPASATLCVTPESVDFGTVGRNSTTASQILQILNVGDEPMGGWNATAVASKGTVNLSATSGSAPDSVSVSVTTTNARGNQTGTITITAVGAVNSVTVNLTWTVN